MNILGINSFFEHPAVALVVDGTLAFAVEEERLTRIKHGRAYSPYSAYVPYASIFAALDFADLKATDIHHVAYSYNSRAHLAGSILGTAFGRRVKSLRQELSAYRTLKNFRHELIEGHALGVRYGARWNRGDFGGAKYVDWEHHLSHAASTFFCSGFDRALVVVADGRGESSCTSIYVGAGPRLERIAHIDLPHSLGFFYSTITHYLGFQPFEDEYKVMGLAAYGEPEFELSLTRVVQLHPEGRYTVDQSALSHLDTLLGPARRSGEELNQHHRNVARSAQAILEKALLHVVSHYLAVTGEKNLSVAGGVFLNCVANGKLAQIEGLDGFFAQPASHDAGTAIGAAALTSVANGGAPQLQYPSMLLGTHWTDDAVEGVLREARLSYRAVAPDLLASETVALLVQDCVVAFFQGRMEFGPRSLGARSFLASPRSAQTRERLNIIKGREQFRPLAPLVPAERFEEFFEGVPNRYMMLAVRAREHTKHLAPAIVHADGTSRAQAVARDDDPLLHRVLSLFEAKSGVPILINTSLNVRGRPIDENPVDAVASAVCSGVDAIVIGRFVVDLRKHRA